ncbi:hypothetical protein [Streptomyces blastmyceticus]|uniref:Secreted protein n=1 Tax=Streptomyces blastmyceticus TaxID=68180 RepID=A0ABN0X7L1_9ACTN
MVGETVVIRGLAAAAAAAAVVGAVLMRRWDRAAGKRVAQLNAARVREEWKTDERIAELETELEEARTARAKVETKLRGKRAELARLRTEHADLLRRYAAAETGRASALEGRRQARGAAPRSAKALESAAASAGTAGSAVAASAYRKAAEALRDLERNATLQRDAESAAAAEPVQDAPLAQPADAVPVPPTGRPEAGTGEILSAADAARAAKRRTGAKTTADAEAAGKRPAPESTGSAPHTVEPAPATGEADAAEGVVEGAQDTTAAMDTEPATDTAPAEDAEPVEDAKRPGDAEAPKSAPRVTRPASAVVPQQSPARRPASRAQGGFDFFGTQRTPAAARPVEETDLADVVGEEALAEAEAAEAGGDDAKGGVIDLTAHDETEQIDVVELRSAIS